MVPFGQSASFSGSSWRWRRARWLPYRDRELTPEWCPNRAQETRVVCPPVRDKEDQRTRAPTQDPSREERSGEGERFFFLACLPLCRCVSACPPVWVSGRPGCVGPVSAASVALSLVVSGALLSLWAPSRGPATTFQVPPRRCLAIFRFLHPTAGVDLEGRVRRFLAYSIIGSASDFTCPPVAHARISVQQCCREYWL